MYSTVDITVSCFISLNMCNVITDGWVFTSLAHTYGASHFGDNVNSKALINTLKNELTEAARFLFRTLIFYCPLSALLTSCAFTSRL